MSTVDLFWRARRAAPLGVRGTEGLGLDWAAIVTRKNEIVERWSKGKKGSLEKQGIAVLQGRASFAGPNAVRVDGSEVSAEKIVVATGSAPARPPIPGIENALTSDELLDLTVLPGRLVVVGGGLIGMELGFCLARAGSKVTLLQRGPEVLPGVDADLRQALLETGRESGMAFHTGANVRRIDADRTVEAVVDGAARRFPADAVLVATGRPPSTAHLGLEHAGVALHRGAIQVNEYLQSVSAPHVYAAGDVAGGHQHTPVAWYEGPIAARNALRGNERKVDLSLLPTAVFTIPALAQVGQTEEEAVARGLDAAVHRSPMKNNPAAGVRGETEGLVKVVYERGSDRVLGVHVLGAHAEDLVQIAAVAMRGGLTRAQVGSMHYVFPTLGGAIFDAMAGW